MTSITGIAKKFFEACETGKGWEGCKAYCNTDATFSAQAEPLAGVKNLQQYTDWMKGLLTFVPDGRYELKTQHQTPSRPFRARRPQQHPARPRAGGFSFHPHRLAIDDNRSDALRRFG